MTEIAAIAMGVITGLVAGVALGFCFILLLGCHQPEMQFITMIHSTMAMIVMGAWVLPAMIRRQS